MQWCRVFHWPVDVSLLFRTSVGREGVYLETLLFASLKPKRSFLRVFKKDPAPHVCAASVLFSFPQLAQKAWSVIL